MTFDVSLLSGDAPPVKTNRPELTLSTDRNKTALTHRVTSAAILYLDERGFKPVETEVPVAHRWIADIAGVCEPTRGESVALRLCAPIPRYRSGSESSASYDATRDKRAAWEAVYAALPWPVTAIVEVKTIRSDFARDRRKWTAEPTADLSYLAVPRGLLRPEELPVGWGVIEVAGDRPYLVKAPVLRVVDAESRLRLVFQVAVRRDNRTRHAYINEVRKLERVKLNDDVNVRRFNECVSAIIQIARDEGATDEVLARYRIKKLSADSQAGLIQIRGLLKK